jgi:hypothetical protein
MFTVSEIVFTVFEILYPVSVIYMTYPGVGSLRGDPRWLRAVMYQLSRSCEFECCAGSLRGFTVPCRESPGGNCAVQGVFGCHARFGVPIDL